jgi:outer membrane protein assembly factor BamB
MKKNFASHLQVPSRAWSSFFAFSLCACLAISCTKQRPLENYNFYGGTSRASNYELGGSFTTMVITDVPKLKAGEDLPKGCIVPPVAISFNHNYLATADGYVIRYANNSIEWKSALDSLASGKRAAPAALTVADKEDNFYILASDGALYSFDKTGKRRWKKPLFTPTSQSLFSDLLILQSSIIAAFSANGTQGTIVKTDLQGTQQWQKEFTLAPTRTLAADEQENVFVGLSNNSSASNDSLLMLRPDGSTQWGQAIQNTRITKSPVYSAGMLVLAGIREVRGERSDVVVSMEASSGKQRWERVLNFAPQGIALGTQQQNSEPLLVVAGYRVGIGEPLTLVYGLNAEGKELWRLSYELAIIGAPMISSENIAFVGTKGDALGVYLMRKDGVFDRVVSLSDAPILCLLPGVDIQNNLVFAMSEQLGLIKVGSLPAQRLLPY